ncbi:hypothetical protein BJ742DRAFT_844639 [Cladochytrium replicatum]|nr:hypothetical protein BJ742DRAFT_844639 [Cladochytrium replicatum]
MKKKDADSFNTLRKQIRDTERLLKRPNLTATAQQEMERRLKGLHKRVEYAKQRKMRAEKEQKLAEKYRMVKFIESKKIQRRVDRITKRLDGLSNRPSNESEPEDEAGSGEDDQNDKRIMSASHSDLETQLAEARLDLAYVKHFPVDMKFISLFPKEPYREETSAKRDTIRATVQAKMEKGALEGLVLREEDVFGSAGADEDDDEEPGATAEIERTTKRPTRTKNSKQVSQQEGDEDEGDDFFL